MIFPLCLPALQQLRRILPLSSLNNLQKCKKNLYFGMYWYVLQWQAVTIVELCRAHTLHTLCICNLDTSCWWPLPTLHTLGQLSCMSSSVIRHIISAYTCMYCIVVTWGLNYQHSINYRRSSLLHILQDYADIVEAFMDLKLSEAFAHKGK